MRHFAFHLVLSLEETPLGKIISNILAQDRNITSKGALLHRVRIRGEFRPRQTRQLPRAVDLKGRLLSCQSY